MVFNSPRSFHLQMKVHIYYSLTVLIFLFLVERLRFKWHSASEVGLACALTGGTNIEISAAILIYAMAYDLVVLLLTTYKLFVNHPSKMLAQSRLIQVIYMDGIIFFIVACVCCFFSPSEPLILFPSLVVFWAIY